MPRVSLGVLAVVVLAACRSDAVAPPSASASRGDADAAYVAPTVAMAVIQTTKSRTAGLDDVLGRLVPVLGVSGLAGPLKVLRDSLTVVNPTARGALLTAAYGAVDRFEPKASPDQLPDLWAIRVALDAVRADEATR